MDDFTSRLEIFKTDVQTISPLEVVHKHLLEQSPFAIDADKYYRLKLFIAEYWNLHYSQVVMVGSGKLGFTIKPESRYRAFSEDTSDLDLAIIARDFFDDCWLKAFEYSKNPGVVLWNSSNKSVFIEHIFNGWVRPDKFPPSQNFPLRTRWWEFFRNHLPSTFSNIPFQINAALYRDWSFFESYHCTGILRCKGSIE